MLLFMILKVVTLNLWLGGELFDNILDFLEQQDADIVLLQEVYNGEDPTLDRKYRSMNVLKARLHYSYEDFVADYRDFDETDGKSQRGNAILSKFPITARRALFFDRPYSETYRDMPGNYHTCPRDLQHVTLETPVGEVNVFNIQGVWDLDGDNYSDKRRRMGAMVTDAVKDLPNVILAGDTNAKPTNQAILEIEKHLKSAFGKEELSTTFNMRRKDNPGYATAAVDMILVSPSIEVLEHACLDVDISDHLPLTATLKI
jgi:endonuclease/exonuclease/phosphatase family metal-dependent hydrolase